MASREDDWGASDSSEDDTVSLTSTVFSDEKDDETYNLEAVLAERKFEDGKTRYLVKWEGYPDCRNTWERKKHFQSEQTLLDWRDQQMQITRGRAKPFDVDAWEREVDKIREATEKRRARRREKKSTMGVSGEQSPGVEPSSSEYWSSSESSDGSSSGVSESEIEPDLSPVWTPREETALTEALGHLKEPNWNMVLEMHGSSGTVNQALKQRTKAALQRKAAMLKTDFDASGKEFPISLPLDHPLSNKSSNIPTGSGRGSAMSQGEPSLPLENALKDIGKPGVGSMGKAGDLSSHKRKAVHRVPRRSVEHEKLAVSTMRKPLRVETASSVPKIPMNLNSPPHPASTTPRLPPHLAVVRPTQSGTVGRGPARKGFSASRPLPRQQVNVMGNWGAEPTKRRKSRYEMKDPTDPRTKKSGKFKKFSTQRKYDVAARFERAPNINSLTFVGLKDGKVLSKPPATVARKLQEKTPFQLLQESMKEQQDEILPLSETPQSVIETASIAARHADEYTHSKSDSKPANTMGATIESTVPLRRASLQTYTQRKTSVPQTYAAPVAMMGYRTASPDCRRAMSDDNDDTNLGKENFGDTGANVRERANSRASATQQMKEHTELNAGQNSHLENSKPQIRKLSMPLLQEQKQQHPTTMNSGQMPSHSTPRIPASPVTDEALVAFTQAHQHIPCLQPSEDGYALFPFDHFGPVERDTHRQDTDVIAEILTGGAAYLLKKPIGLFKFSSEPMGRDGPDTHLVRLFPAGQVILLTDSLLLFRPKESARILTWFRLFALPNKPPGTWKICTRPAIREWLLSLQERFNYPHGADFVRCYGEIMRLSPNDLTTDAAPIVCMGDGGRDFDETIGTSTDLNDREIMKNDSSLVNWFAGWSMTKQENFRRFHVVTGREEESEQHKKLKDAARKYNHVSIMSLEKFENSLKMWDWARIEREEEKRRAEAAEAEERLARQKTQSPDLPDYQDDESMLPPSRTEEESLFLPMDLRA
ncbi:MAG: hypothetical protein Q9169_005217 [Polycauliona sp. 2 TL-2023]